MLKSLIEGLLIHIYKFDWLGFKVRVVSLLRSRVLNSVIFKGAVGSALVMIIGLVLNLFVGVLLARRLGPGDYGFYSFVLSLVALAALPTRAGLPTLLVREISAGQLEGKLTVVKGMLASSNSFVFIYSILVSVVSVCFMFLFLSDKPKSYFDVYFWALLLLPVISFEGVRTGALRGFQKVVSAQLPEQIVRPFVLISLLLMSGYLQLELTAVSVMKFYLVAAVLALIAGFVFLLRALPAQIREVQGEYHLKVWFYSLIPLSLFSGISILDSQITTIFLGFMGSQEDVGFFRVAAAGSSLVSFGLSAINMALAPQVVRLYKAGALIELQKTIMFATRCAAMVSFPVVLIFIVWGEYLIDVVFGAEFTPAWISLIVLSLAQLINATCGSVVLVLNMTGNERSTLVGAVLGLFFNVVFSVLLIPFYGVLGAAIGYAVSLSLWNLILVYVTRKKTGLNTFLI